MLAHRSAHLLTMTGLAVLVSLVSASAEIATPVPSILVSRQLLKSEHLTVGDVVSLSSSSTGDKPRSFRIVGAYEPTPDPRRLGSAWLEARLHLPDLLALTQDASDPLSGESVGAINIRMVDSSDANAFSRELAGRLPGLLIHPTIARGDEAAPFVVLERFHLAIALVTVIASAVFLLALMVMLVDERRETIAILLLIGLRKRRILLQVFVEGLLLAIVGACFGILVAAACQGFFNEFFQWRYATALVFVRVTPQIAWRSVLLSVPLGVLASVISSWSILRRDAFLLARR